jgi:hypothetical protein
MSYQIEYDIEVPPKSIRKPRKMLYPLASMDVGASFFVPAGDNPKAKMSSVRQTVHHYSRRMAESGNKVMFVTRSVIEDETLGIRVFRVE